MSNLLDILLDTLLDGAKILPFLLATYVLMEYIEHKTSSKTKRIIEKSGNFGPIIGGFLGAVPQCGFSVAATNFYAGRVITMGTLISIYLSTSDEMLPILMAEGTNIGLILKILAIKIAIGIFAGTIIDLILRITQKKKEEKSIESICEHEHCHCEEGIIKSAIKHTISILVFIILISFALNLLIGFVGEDKIASVISNNVILRTSNCIANWINTKLCIISCTYSNVY